MEYQEEFESLSDTGVLQQVEDAGYPFVSLCIEFPEDNYSEYFSLNLEFFEDLDMGSLTEMIGKQVTFEYDGEVDLALFELVYGDKHLLDSNMDLNGPDIHQITGRLSNAEAPTEGDLPNEIYVVTEEEITYEFLSFITPEIVEANGQIVTAYFEERPNYQILSLEIPE
ncbi:MAG: hypothetical protein KGS48_09295 [Bacteroidetes bacterium]|nr:hypothetical protein [Bacteroidota bacterium]